MSVNERPSSQSIGSHRTGSYTGYKNADFWKTDVYTTGIADLFSPFGKLQLTLIVESPVLLLIIIFAFAWIN